MLTVGSILNSRYKLKKELKNNESSTVFLAKDLKMGNRDVIIKAINAKPGDSLIEAAKRGCKIHETIKNREFPRFIESVDGNDAFYIVRQYIKGKVLSEIIDAGLTIDRVLDWIEQLCTLISLLHAHYPSVLFVGLKTSNIVIKENGRLGLLDFSSAYPLDASLAVSYLHTATPGFTAPELVERTSIDHRVDVFGIGMIMTEMYESVREDVDCDIDRRINSIIGKCTDPHCENRYPEVSEIKKEILELRKLVEDRMSHKAREKKNNNKLCLSFMVAICVAGVMALVMFGTVRVRLLHYLVDVQFWIPILIILGLAYVKAKCKTETDDVTQKRSAIVWIPMDILISLTTFIVTSDYFSSSSMWIHQGSACFFLAFLSIICCLMTKTNEEAFLRNGVLFGNRAWVFLLICVSAVFPMILLVLK